MSLPDAAVLPDELLQVPRWLLWKYVQQPDGNKPRKLPIYTTGGLRGRGFGLDTEQDVSQLASFDDAFQKLVSSVGEFAGLGYALIGNDGIGGIDLDNCLDAEGKITNPIADRILQCAISAGAYVEVSPSGRGLRIVGSTAGFVNFNRKGFEAYCEKRYLTITGNCYANPRRFGSIDTSVALMDTLVPGAGIDDASKLSVRRGRDATNLATDGYSMPDHIAEGGRNDAILKYVGRLRGKGAPEDLIPELAINFNDARCRPPLDEAEVLDIASRYAKEPVTLNVGDWPEPKEIKAALPGVPAFDLAMLPKVFQAYVKDTAELMQAPPDYIAIPLMIAAAAALGNSWAIAPKARDIGWLVTPVLWGGIVGRPGMRKSPAMNKAMVHLDPIEAGMDAAHQQNLHSYTANKIAYDALLYAAKKAAKTGGPVAPLPPEPQSPEPERLVVHDSTYQKLTDILQWSPRGVLVARDELVGLLEFLASEGQEGARAFYLQAWNGNQPYKVDRVGRGSLVIKRLAIWLVGGIQPGKLQTYVREAVVGGNGDDGLLQRFQLIVWPDVPPKWQYIDRLPDVVAFDKVQATFQSLRALSPMAVGAHTGLGNGPAYLHFTKEAQLKYNSIWGVIETSLRNCERHPALEAHFAKYPSLLAALALVIHLCDGGTGAVTLEPLTKAGRWLTYLMAHAERVYSIATNSAAHSAKSLADKIKTGALANEFSAREVYRKQWSRLTSPHDVMEAIEWLTDADWLRKADKSTDSDRKTTYIVNPRVLAGVSNVSAGRRQNNLKTGGNSQNTNDPLTDNTDSITPATSDQGQPDAETLH